MAVLLVALHVIICIMLILIILLQAGRGADLGSAFGGSSQTLFGTRRGNWLTRFTTICAALFMVTSFALTFVYSYRPSIKERLLEEDVKVEEETLEEDVKVEEEVEEER
jgi:preprotein translocase subunit SecG